jgi:hypothetical protein
MFEESLQVQVQPPVQKTSWRECVPTWFYACATLSCTLCLGFMSIRVYRLAENLATLDVSRLNDLINITITLENRLFPPPS